MPRSRESNEKQKHKDKNNRGNDNECMVQCVVLFFLFLSGFLFSPGPFSPWRASYSNFVRLFSTMHSGATLSPTAPA